MKKYKIKVTPEQSKAIQLRCFELGINWAGDNEVKYEDRPYLYIGKYHLLYGTIQSTFDDKYTDEITADYWLTLYGSKVSKVHLAPVINELHNTVVHCRTKAESISLTTLMQNAGWEIPGRQLKWAWESLVDEDGGTCGIGVYQRNSRSYCDIKWFVENGYDIISLSEFYRLQNIHVANSGHDHSGTTMTYASSAHDWGHDHTGGSALTLDSMKEVIETLETEVYKCHAVPHSLFSKSINNIRRYMSLQTPTDRQIKSIPTQLLPVFEAGWINNDFSLNSYGKEAMLEFLLDENLKKFSAHAAKVVKTEKARLKNER